MGLTAIDLFAGAGGFTEGAAQAGLRVIWAANHYVPAVRIHAANHPEVDHLCQDLHQADWTGVPAHDVLLASPSCQGHTNARGRDRPHHDAARATAWAVVSCAEVHRPALLVVENVPAFLTWALYPAWEAALHALGYALTVVVADAADFGVPQHRGRAFVIGVRAAAPLAITLPRQPHCPVAPYLRFDDAYTWAPIDRPGRAEATLARVRAGRNRFGDRFVMPYYGSGSGQTGRSIDRPLGTLTTRARWAVVDGDRMRMVHTEEARSIMGFRPDYRLPPDQRTGNHLLGNAVPPPMAAGVIRAALEAA